MSAGTGNGKFGRVLVCGAFAMALVDAWLLQRKYNFATGGFLTDTHLNGFGDLVVFVALCTICNIAVAAPLCGLALRGAARIRLSRAATVFVVATLAVAPIAALDFIYYQLWAYLGDAFDVSLLFELTGRHLSEFVAVAAQSALVPLLVLAAALAGVVFLTWLIHTRTTSASVSDDRPSTTGVLERSVAALGAGLLVVGLTAGTSEKYDYGLRRTSAGKVLGYAVNALSDVDGDGYGFLRKPRDPAPFNPRIHPYAVDEPGNGIDEDGVAGDLPFDSARYSEPPAPAGDWPARPSVVLIVLESFRADALGAALNGRPVTPVLDALARSGVSVPEAYSHNGYTIQSRFHILSGSLAGLRGGTTLLDDFKQRGYQTAYFSAQDETFGGQPIDARNIDVFYDARQDRDKRFSFFTTPGSLAVPFTVLEQRLGHFLTARPAAQPLFLYVNYQDTHFPYHHPGVQPLVDPTVVPQSAIAPARADDVRRMYLNTASNVDASIGRLMDMVRRTMPDPGVIVLADHGESLFDSGFLGHGYALNDAQTRIPMAISGLPLRIREPFGQIDLRDALADALRTLRPRGDRTPTLADGDGRVFQYLGTLDHPAEVGWTLPGRRVVYDFRTDRFGDGAASQRVADLAAGDRAAFEDLLHYWEAARWAQAQQERGRTR